MTIARRFLPALPLVALLTAGVARAETKASVDLSAEAGYGSNPFLGVGSNQDTGTLSLTAAPAISIQGPTSNVDLTGRVQENIFTSHYTDTTNWSLGAASVLKLSPLSSFTLRAGYSSEIYSGIYGSGASPLPPAEGQPLPPTPDPSITETAGLRTQTLTGNAGFQGTLSPRDTLTLSASAAKLYYPSTLNSDYVNYGGAVDVDHAFNSKFSGGLGFDYSKTDYDKTGYGSLQNLSPSARAMFKLSPRTTLNVSAGVTFSQSSGGLGPSTTATYFSGNATLCNNGARSNLCVVAARSVGASGLAGNSTINSIGGNYSYTLTPRSSFRLSADYSESHTIGFGTGYDTGYLDASAGYQLQFTQRLSFTASARYTDPFKSPGARNTSFYGSLGVSYRLGR